MNRRRFAVHAGRGLGAWALAATLWGSRGSALAAGAEAPPHIRGELPQARLAGQGSFRWFGLKLYDARLWVGAPGVLASTPLVATFALDLRYARSLQGAKIAAASRQQMQELGLGTAPQHARWQSGMEQLFPDVKEGTHLTGIYLPEQGARFYLDGKLLGAIMDAEFARAFFAIWLDAGTSAPALRAALLADAAPR